jgi:hypothetical protein
MKINPGSHRSSSIPEISATVAFSFSRGGKLNENLACFDSFYENMTKINRKPNVIAPMQM